MRQIPGTIIVNFQPDVSEVEINGYLAQENIDGVRVSCFGTRYAVEVPAGQEDEFVQKFSSCPLIKSVNPYFLKGLKERSRREIK